MFQHRRKIRSGAGLLTSWFIACILVTALSSHAPAGPAAPPCGNGVLDPGEQCDDGNAQSGDACSPVCKWEKPVPILTRTGAAFLVLVLVTAIGLKVRDHSARST